VTDDAFLAPVLGAESLDRWLIRSRILEAVRAELPRMRGTLLDVGCGRQPYRPLVTRPPSRVTRYVGIDVPSDRYHTRDVSWDGLSIPLASASVDQVLATELLEHCPYPQRVLDEVARVVRPGGRVLLTVPFLWPLHETPFDEHRYTPYALQRMLGAAGFEDIEVTALGGWDASLAQMLGLWVRRRPMGHRRKRLLSRLLVPVVRALVRRDDRTRVFGENAMATGFAATAVRAS
jgi:SAM-dependent methyltransferase